MTNRQWPIPNGFALSGISHFPNPQLSKLCRWFNWGGASRAQIARVKKAEADGSLRFLMFAFRFG
jgi:hypothetical protein